jgi:L-fuconolactonase
MPILRDDFLPEHLVQVSRTTGIDGFVTVQARQSVAETEALIEIAQHNDLVLGVVGWVPLADPNVGAELARLSQSRWLKGVRHVVQDEPDDRFMLRPDFDRGIAMLPEFGLVYDILIYARQLPAAIEMVDRHPNVQMVLDHIAKPEIRYDRFDDQWERDFRELAKRPNVACKFSGVVTEMQRRPGPKGDAWDVDSIRRYWDVALEAFSPERLMFGSDWPVCLLRSPYSRWLETVGELSYDLQPQQRYALFSSNAARVYRLDVPSDEW